MTSLKIAALFVFATATISAQDLKTNEVPANLQTIFTKSYHNAADVEWEKKGEYYKVEFEVKRYDHDVWYNSQGNVVKSKIEISRNDLPAAITSAIKAKYADYKIDSAEVREEGAKKTYHVEIEKGWNMERKLIVDASGNIVSDIED